MTLTEPKSVICAKCGTEHQTRPAEREGIDGDGKPIWGIFAVDYTYYHDMYLDQGYVTLCNRHTRDEVSLNAVEGTYSGN